MLQTRIAMLLVAGMFCCTSCIQHNFLHSPFQGNTAVYHAVPVASDSVPAATYLSAALSIGGMNDELRDQVYALQAGLHRASVLKAFRLHYGAAFMLGSYDLRPGYTTYRNTDSVFNRNTGAHFYGGYGLFGGISAATPMGRRGEWRYIGVEASLYNEFGDYYTLRKSLPDSAVTEIDRKRYLGAAGISTELVFKGRSQNKFGIKIAVGSYLRKLPYHNGFRSSYTDHSYDELVYFSNTYHFSFQRTTAYFQFNFATHAAHFQTGINFRF